MESDKFFVRIGGRQWHLADREEVRVHVGDQARPVRLRIVYVLRCSSEPYDSDQLSDIERELPMSTRPYDVCGHNPCGRWKKRVA